MFSPDFCELVISHLPVRRCYSSRFGDAFCMAKCNASRSCYLPKFHPMLRLPRKETLQHHQILHLPRKVTLQHRQVLHLPRKIRCEDLSVRCESYEWYGRCEWCLMWSLCEMWVMREMWVMCGMRCGWCVRWGVSDVIDVSDVEMWCGEMYWC